MSTSRHGIKNNVDILTPPHLRLFGDSKRVRPSMGKPTERNSINGIAIDLGGAIVGVLNFRHVQPTKCTTAMLKQGDAVHPDEIIRNLMRLTRAGPTLLDPCISEMRPRKFGKAVSFARISLESS